MRSAEAGSIEVTRRLGRAGGRVPDVIGENASKAAVRSLASWAA